MVSTGVIVWGWMLPSRKEFFDFSNCLGNSPRVVRAGTSICWVVSYRISGLYRSM